MLDTFFAKKIKDNFKFNPTHQQNQVIELLSRFLSSKSEGSVFLLRGYAGTGKTSLVGALVQALVGFKQKVVLMAPTGRAAKVFSSYANYPAFTIHKQIYREKKFGADERSFDLNQNLYRDTTFIVDEASMIANQGLSAVSFGSGCLLDDLIQYVYNNQNCKLILMGDTAQLPPVGEELSPALVPDHLVGYGLEVHQYELSDVVRQDEASGVLFNATALRQALVEEQVHILPKIKLKGFTDISYLSGQDLIDTLSASYSRYGMDESIVICRSNKRANLYNKGIRSTVLYREDELNTSDLLMVNKNNYFWSKAYKELDFIANGEIIKVERLSNTYELYGFRFADATISLPDHDSYELDVKLLLNTLHTETPALSRGEQEQLFQAILEDYADVRLKKDRIKKIKEDPHFNALQVKYAYAITGHKAQGGQWSSVFLDQGYITKDYVDADYYRWLYTAFTRASEHLYLVNYPKGQLEDADDLF